MKIISSFTFTLAFLLMLYGNVFATAEMDWRQGFDRVCAISAESESLTIDQLNELITESDELLVRIKASEDPKKKLYLIRLKKCRNFLVFMRDFKQK
jgi:hypothetical protein